MITSELKGEREEAGSVRRKKRMPTQTCPNEAVGFVSRRRFGESGAGRRIRPT